jgi:hypothetical protein
MKDAFDQKQHLAKCLALPARDPEPYYRPDRKRVPPYFSDIVVLRDHADEFDELKANGVPHHLARAMVLVDYAHTHESIEKRAKEAARQ